MIVAPPLLAGATNATDNDPVDTVVATGVATTFVGAPGTFGTFTVFENADQAPAPTAFTART